MSRPLSKKQIGELDKRIKATAGSLSERDRQEYQTYISYCAQIQNDVSAEIASIDLCAELETEFDWDVVGRTKTFSTIAQKLVRGDASLQTMRDIAGVRIKADVSLGQQDRIVAVLQQRLSEGRVIDRRRDPRSGYRALHLAIRYEGIPVEIQVRTALQHVWAETYERVADRVGRDIRYGKPVPDGNVHAQRVVDLLQALSLNEIATIENREERSAANPISRLRYQRAHRRLESQVAELVQLLDSLGY
ncbi:MAG: hypothetical protein WC054_02465 [Candidatus Nanopelagicales bacterium]